MIRELREENDKLKKVLIAMAQGKPIDLKELGVNDLSELVETMDENSKAMEDMEKPWAEKLKEEKERDKQAQEHNPSKREDRRVPHLTNLNEDPQLTGKVYYSLLDCKWIHSYQTYRPRLSW
jgi:hypothetical protein